MNVFFGWCLVGLTGSLCKTLLIAHANNNFFTSPHALPLQIRRYQKNTGRRKCILLLLLIIFGLIIVLIFKPKRHSASHSIPAPVPIPNPSSTPNSHFAVSVLGHAYASSLTAGSAHPAPSTSLAHRTSQHSASYIISHSSLPSSRVAVTSASVSGSASMLPPLPMPSIQWDGWGRGRGRGRGEGEGWTRWFGFSR